MGTRARGFSSRILSRVVLTFTSRPTSPRTFATASSAALVSTEAEVASSLAAAGHCGVPRATAGCNPVPAPPGPSTPTQQSRLDALGVLREPRSMHERVRPLTARPPIPRPHIRPSPRAPARGPMDGTRWKPVRVHAFGPPCRLLLTARRLRCGCPASPSAPTGCGPRLTSRPITRPRPSTTIPSRSASQSGESAGVISVASPSPAGHPGSRCRTGSRAACPTGRGTCRPSGCTAACLPP